MNGWWWVLIIAIGLLVYWLGFLILDEFDSPGGDHVDREEVR
jgi:hypothetical protein